jgi:hypothetical protein
MENTVKTKSETISRNCPFNERHLDQDESYDYCRNLIESGDWLEG